MAEAISPVDIAPTVVAAAALSSFALSSSPDLLGVSVQCIQDVAAMVGWSGTDDGLSMQKKARGFTAGTDLSVLDQLLQDEKAEYLGKIRKANRLISYCWSYTFSELAEALKSCAPTDVVWIDLLSSPQNGETTKPFSWWRQTFFKLVGQIGAVSIVLRSNHSLEPLSRAWCMYELLVCIETQSAFEILMPPQEWQAFLTTMQEDSTSFLALLTHVQIAQCQTSDPHDKERILHVIKDNGGVAKVNSKLNARLQAWLFAVMGRAAERSSEEAERAVFQHALGTLHDHVGAHAQAQIWFEKACTGRAAALGAGHRQTLQSLQAWGSAQARGGEEREGAERLAECAEKQAALLGDSDPDTLRTARALGAVYRQQGRLEEAGRALGECAELSRALPPAHPEAVRAARELAGVLEERRELAEAERVLRECLEAEEAAGGVGDDTMAQLAGVCEQRGRVEESAGLWVRLMDRSRDARGEGHVDTLTAAVRVAWMRKRQGRLAEAAGLYEGALRRWREGGAEEHPGAVAAMGRLGAVYYQMGRTRDAEGLLEEAVTRCRAVLGEGHAETVTAQQWLAEAAVERRREDAAQCTCGVM